MHWIIKEFLNLIAPNEVYDGGTLPEVEVTADRIIPIRETFPQPLDGGQLELLAIILLCIKEQQVTDKRHIAYILATAWHESDKFYSLVEYGSKAYFDRYEGRRDLGNIYPGDGYKYRGRGFVQVTGRANYERFSNILGLDLVNKPEKASEPHVAAKILVIGMWMGVFTGKGLLQYFNDMLTDWINARRVVNHLDRAQDIAIIAKNIYNHL